MVLTWNKFVAVWFVLLQQNGGLNHELNEEDDPGPGHLKPFGYQRPSAGQIDVVKAFPDPLDFYVNYVLPGRPLLIKDGARQIPAFTLWNDAYLLDKYGMEYFEVEIGKKENRQGDAKKVRLQTFLKIYNDTDIYLVQDAHESMKGDLTLPRSLQCGVGFQVLQAVLWFSSGGTVSVLHNDQPDNINCILDGNKEIIFVDRIQEPNVEADGWVHDGGYSRVDVQSVDLKKFPRFRSLPWWPATMLKGDCLFIPYKWYHTVKSSNTRNLAVNLWFNHLMWFNETDCEQNARMQDHVSLENIELHGLDSIEMLRVQLFNHLEGQDEINLDDVVRLWSEVLVPEEAQQIFGLVDKDHDMVLTWEEIYNLDILSVAKTFPELYNLVDEDVIEQHLHDEL